MNQVWYHKNCADGFGAALAAYLSLGPGAKYVPVQYGEPMPAAEPGDTIYILDFSYPAPDLVALAQRVGKTTGETAGGSSGKVSVFDHHATAAEELTLDRIISLFGPSAKGKSSAVSFAVENMLVHFDQKTSGAVLAWWHFHLSGAPKFLQYLEDRDLWLWKLPQSREVSAAIRSYPMTFEDWLRISGLPEDARRIDEPATQEAMRLALNKLKAEGEAILRYQNQLVAQMAEREQFVWMDVRMRDLKLTPPPVTSTEEPPHASHAELGVWMGPAVNATCLQSEVAEALLAKWTGYPLAAVYMDLPGGRRVFSLRSRPGFNCSQLAKWFGGGGHPQAAGFTWMLEEE